MTVRRETCCLPCMNGEHGGCRHRPDGPRFGRPPESAACQCEQSGHTLGDGTCSDCRMGDYSDYHRCGRPAKATVTVRSRFKGETVEVERCGVHAAGLRRQAENDAKRAEESRARRELWERENANGQASEDWCARLATLGVVAEPQGGARLRVALDPERLYGMIHEAVVEMDAAGIEHRFLTRPE